MLTRFTTCVARSVKRFHEDECGNESLQTIMIMAIGALVMVGLHTIWQSDMRPKVIEKLGLMFGLDFTTAS